MTATTVVTGATGHVGANLVRALLARGRRVRALVHEESRALDGLDVEVVGGDVRDRDAVTRALAGADVVHHLAAVISIDGDQGGRVPAVNVGGARNVAEAALATGARRLVHYCSIHAFDQAPVDRPVDEARARALGPAHPVYDRSKAEGEAAVRAVVARGLDAVILHPTGILGPVDFAPSRMGQFFLDLYHRRMPALVRGGFDWVDVRDVVAAGLAAEERGRKGESYLVPGHWQSVRALADLAAAHTGVPAPRWDAPMWLARLGAPLATAANRLGGGQPLFTADALRALRAGPVSGAKAAHELGHAPRPTRETVAAVYDWLEGAGRLGGRGRAATTRGERAA